MQTILIAILLIGLFLAQALIGGAKVVFAIPAYMFIAVAGIVVLPLAFRKTKLGAKQWAVLSAVLLAGYIFWRAVHSPIPGLSLTDTLMILAAFCVYLLAALYIETPKARLWLLSGCFLFGYLHVVAGILQFRYENDFMFLSHLPDTSPIPQIFRNASGWRASGFYVCPNHMAGYLESLAAFAVAYCCWGRFSAIGRVILGYVVVFCLVGIALTGSRGGYLSTGFGLTVLVFMSLWFLKKLRSSRLGVTMIGAVILGGLVIGGAAFGMTRNATIGNRMNDISYDAGSIRFDMWQAAVQQWKVSPVIGTGAGTYLYYGRQFRTPNVQRDPIHAHCDYLELLAEYGIVGCVLMGLFIVTHVYVGATGAMSILRNRLRASGRSFSNELAVIAGALATVAALLAHSVVDFNFHLPANTLFFAAVFGFLACPTTDPQLITVEKTPLFIRAMCFLLPVVAGFLAFKAGTAFKGEYHTEWARVHLRNKLFVDSLASFQQSLGWGLAPVAAGVIAPAHGAESDWSYSYQREHLFQQMQAEAEKGMKFGPQNVDAPYYLAESQHFMGVYEPNPARRVAYHEGALRALQRGQALFPQDSRYSLKLARTFTTLGRFAEAEEQVAKSIEADPNAGNGYAIYGYVLWQQRKLLRAEAYYRRAVNFPTGNDLAAIGLKDVARIRALAGNPDHVERFGDPLEDYDMEPPTPEDMARGVGVEQ